MNLFLDGWIIWADELTAWVLILIKAIGLFKMLNWSFLFTLILFQTFMIYLCECSCVKAP